MRPIVAVALLLLLVGCSHTNVRDEPDTASALTTSKLIGCISGSPRKGAIYGTFDVAWGQQTTGAGNRYIAIPGDIIKIEPSNAAGYACVTYTRQHQTDITLRLAVRAAAPDGHENLIDHFDTTTTPNSTHRFTMLAVPGVSKTTLLGAYFYDDVAAGDSGGTWGGGKR